jgi:Zn-finger nucleic acid-binding protein
MICPIDKATLVMSERNGIEIDYCPECRGVWLDRGELDKIIERSASFEAPKPQQPSEKPYPDSYQDSSKHYSKDQDKHSKPKKKENFLGDIFDF